MRLVHKQFYKQFSVTPGTLRSRRVKKKHCVQLDAHLNSFRDGRDPYEEHNKPTAADDVVSALSKSSAPSAAHALTRRGR